MVEGVASGMAASGYWSSLDICTSHGNPLEGF